VKKRYPFATSFIHLGKPFIPTIGKKYPALLVKKGDDIVIQFHRTKALRDKAQKTEAEAAERAANSGKINGVRAAFPDLDCFATLPPPVTAMRVNEGLTRVWFPGEEPIDIEV
jgi:hypothetical protein